MRDSTVVVLNNYLSIRSAVTSKGNRLWHYLILSQFPTSWYLGISSDRLIGLTSNRVSLNRVASAINVYHVRCLVVSRVGNVNSNVFLAILNSYGCHITLTRRVTGNCIWRKVSPVSSIAWPVTIGNFTSDIINSCVTEDLSNLLCGCDLVSVRILNINSPRNGLVQVTIVSTINRLIGRSLTIAWHWISVVDLTVLVSYIDNNILNTIWSCRPSLWNVLTRYNLITLWNLRINSNMLGRLTIQIRMANFNIIIVGISINNLTCLRIRIINKFVTITAANKRITDYHIIGDFLRLSSFKPINWAN